MRRHVPLLSHLARLKRRGDFFEGGHGPARIRDVIADAGIVVELPKKEISSEDREKLEREVERLRAEAAKIELRLADSSFLSRAPTAVVEKTKQQLEEISERIVRLSGNLVGTSDR